jgi:hypothetical protein
VLSNYFKNIDVFCFYVKIALGGEGVQCYVQVQARGEEVSGPIFLSLGDIIDQL